MAKAIRVMVERGKKKRTVASAFDWSGWDRSGKTEEAALQVLDHSAPMINPSLRYAGAPAYLAGGLQHDPGQRPAKGDAR